MATHNLTIEDTADSGSWNASLFSTAYMTISTGSDRRAWIGFNVPPLDLRWGVTAELTVYTINGHTWDDQDATIHLLSASAPPADVPEAESLAWGPALDTQLITDEADFSATFNVAAALGDPETAPLFGGGYVLFGLRSLLNSGVPVRFQDMNNTLVLNSHPPSIKLIAR